MTISALTPQELTGRARTHLVTLTDPPCTLHRDVVGPFLALRAAAADAGIDLLPASSFRDFDRQLAIWNAKCRGERDLYDRNGDLLDHASLGQDELVSAILVWSALPGASRHHWGSEIDVYDGHAVAQGEKIDLMPAEYAPGGKFERLGAWLDARLTEFGFYRPYATERGGVQPEPWHISHVATATAALAALTPAVLRDALDGAGLGGAEIVTARLPEIFDRYVVNVEPAPGTPV
ncbi:MAG: M15 family metallopeptidase [Steroidobacteraceae bacterium]